MASHGHGGHGSGVDPNFVNDKNYETRDVSLNTLVVWLFFLFVFVAATAGVVFIMYRFVFRIGFETSARYALPHVRELPRMRLQANPVQEIKDFRLNEDAILNHYGKDPKTGALHVPIERAMDLVSQEGLPTRAVPGQLDAQEPDEPSHAQGQATPGSEAETSPASAIRQTIPNAKPGGSPAVPPAAEGETATPDSATVPDNNSGTTTP